MQQYQKKGGKSTTTSYKSSKGNSYTVGTYSSKPKEPVVLSPTGSGGKGNKFACRHWKAPVTLSEGVVIHASGSSDKPYKEEWEYPDVGVFFASSWDASKRKWNVFSDTWKGPELVEPDHEDKWVGKEVAVLDWPDMSTPNVTLEAAKLILEYALNKAGEGKFVEIGCVGGHGRTGTGMAAMKILLGELDAFEACLWVWENYCCHAIESDKQEKWLYDFAKHIHGEAAVPMPPPKKKAKTAPLVKVTDKRAGSGHSPSTGTSGTPLSSGLDSSEPRSYSARHGASTVLGEQVFDGSDGSIWYFDYDLLAFVPMDEDDVEYEDQKEGDEVNAQQDDDALEEWLRRHSAGEPDCGVCGWPLRTCMCTPIKDKMEGEPGYL